jgi:hypothetical protein
LSVTAMEWAPGSRAWQILLATSQDDIKLEKRGFKM